MKRVLPFILLAIITIPAVVSLAYGAYFSMHDDQHIARLYLLDQSIRQGYLYPRWVGGLGFGFGYPLFNFYPPLIYFVGMLFHLLGFSLLSSIKLVVVTGFYLSAVGMYLFAKKLLGRWPALVAATLYTYFLYHGVTAYVRGALAEFFSMAILPFVFLFIWTRSTLFYGIAFSLLILTHPLIAFPALLFIGAFFVFNFFSLKKEKLAYVLRFGLGSLIGLGLSAFFWLPSMVERKYTLVDAILTKELANYAIHFVCPSQLWFSLWGYGGSIAGCEDGITFQLGRVHIALAVFSIATFILYIFVKNRERVKIREYLFFVLLCVVSIVMLIPISKPLWDQVHFLSYLQFPWRFLTFTAFFISVCGAFGIYFLERIAGKRTGLNKCIGALSVLIIAVVIYKYAPLFRPQQYLNITDADKNNVYEIQWRISKSSFEFIPKGVATKKTNLNTTVPAIDDKIAVHEPYEILTGKGEIMVDKNLFQEKIFLVKKSNGLTFRLNTFFFPGWNAYLDGKTVSVDDTNPLKLITVSVPAGDHTLKFVYDDTPVRKIAGFVSILTLLGIVFYSFKFVKIKR